MKEVGPQGSVIASDLGEAKVNFGTRYTSLDICDKPKYEALVKDNKIDYIVHLAAILSATGELYPDKACQVNVDGAITAMNIAREVGAKIFLPSTIAVFGGDKFQKDKSPADSILQPTTMYGVSKVFNEQLGTYYNRKFSVDFRCIRYPGVISSEKYAFNGTAMYSTRKPQP
jgi:nucleoside-diphosphate-sugar epimerase